MAAFTGSDLKRWRMEQGIPAEVLAERISVDVTTLYRYESGKLKANPDVMYEICAELGDVDRWVDWMRTEYPGSYGRVHPESYEGTVEGSIMKMYAEIGDCTDIWKDVLKDAADGEFDDEELRNKLRDEVTELLRAAQRVRNLLGGKHGR